MNTPRFSRHPLSFVWIASVVFTLLLSACQAAGIFNSFQPAQTLSPVPPTTPEQLPVDEPVSQVVQTPTQAADPSSDTSADIIQDLSGVAESQIVETVAAVMPSTDGPWWGAAPQHRLLTLQGYSVTDHLMKPQIFVYPLAELAEFNEYAGQMAADLQALLQTRQAGDRMPFLPIYNAAQVMHAQVQYLNFKNGKGVRFLTQFDQAALPINNYELIYTFQGITDDGKYYIAAVLPVTHPELPANEQVNDQQMAELADFPAYMTNTVSWLNQQASASLNPDLANLDALIQSIQVK